MRESWTITRAAFDQLTQEARQVAEQARRRRPERTSWGIASEDDALPPSAGGGRLLWFDTKAGLLDFTGRLLPFVAPDFREADPGRVARQTRAIVDWVSADKLDLDAARADLDRVLQGVARVRWWGSFQDLVDGDRAFERRLRAEFRGQADERPAPITARELEAFIGHLRGRAQ